MQTSVSKSEFKARALEVMREVEATGKSIVITDRGKPTIEIRPYHSKETSPLDTLKGSVTEYIDPTSPIAEDDWESA